MITFHKPVDSLRKPFKTATFPLQAQKSCGKFPLINLIRFMLASSCKSVQ